MKKITTRIPRLGYHTDKDQFFSKLEVGSIFTYSLAYMFTEIVRMAGDHGLIIEYCKSGSPEYTKYGAVTVKVIKNKFHEEEKIFHFDPQHLDI